LTRVIVSPEALDRAAGGADLEISEDDHHHLARVLRLDTGAAIEVIDGAGRRAAAAITAIGDGRCVARLDSPVETIARLGPRLISVVALIKGERMDWAIAKLVELGVDRIVPVRCERCVVKVTGDRAEARVQRFVRLAESAARQCGRAELPDIDPIADFDAAIASIDAAARLIFSPLASRSIAAALGPGAESIALATGPEGGFTRAEIERATAAGYADTLLGPRVLRAETAAITALAATSALRGELGGPGPAKLI
jgi:16S rRNA (uracil1498-N3)-methyltransferase